MVPDDLEIAHTWYLTDDGYIALAFPMPQTPLFVECVQENNDRWERERKS